MQPQRVGSRDAVGRIFRVFLSGTTSEFGLARDEIASDLGARGLTIFEESLGMEHPSTVIVRRNYAALLAAMAAAGGSGGGSAG